ncbi:MAG: YXWGXW repeat-containing protein [Planctomycetes bacterium]|nr:YXWGXW repeat-containing protein [Planctomycetota bacterium]
MIRRISTLGWVSAGAIIAAASLAAVAQPPSAPPPLPDERQPARPLGEDDGVTIRTRGPLHEAFARPYATDPEPGIIISQQPPEPVDELPPEHRPEGDNVIWIPGYWSWDEEASGFLWISGMWRDVPPDRTWVPGNWTRTGRGWQWIAGFWASADQGELNYFDEPPRSLEAGPSSPAPSEEYFWVPGCWIWQDVDYAWRPGYWTPAYEGWVWVPANYVWTPRGCVFVDGYWDHELVDRGVLFAPVYFERDIYRTRGFYHRPNVVLDVRPLVLHLFVRPQYHHYYFGDFYDDRYAGYGIRPWAAFYAGGRHYDPLLTYYSWRYRSQGFDFGERVHGWHQYFARHEDARPPRTYHQQRQFAVDHRDDDWSRFATLSRPLEEVVENRDGGREFRRLEPERRRELGQRVRELRELAQRRVDFEAQREADAPTRDVQPGEAQPDPAATPDTPRRRGPISRGALRLPGRDRDVARQPEPPATRREPGVDGERAPTAPTPAERTPTQPTPTPRTQPPAPEGQQPDRGLPAVRPRIPERSERDVGRPDAGRIERPSPPRPDQPADRDGRVRPRGETSPADIRPRGEVRPRSEVRPPGEIRPPVDRRPDRPPIRHPRTGGRSPRSVVPDLPGPPEASARPDGERRRSARPDLSPPAARRAPAPRGGIEQRPRPTPPSARPAQPVRPNPPAAESRPRPSPAPKAAPTAPAPGRPSAPPAAAKPEPKPKKEKKGSGD